MPTRFSAPKSVSIRLLSIGLFLTACSSKGDDTATDGSGGEGSDGSDGSDGGDSGGEQVEFTLDNCGGSVGEGVPEPYASWFRCADLALDGTRLLVQSTGLPPHKSPYYEETDPNWEAWDDRGGDWHQNPNVIAYQVMVLQIPLDPTPKGLTITAEMVDQSAGTSDEEYHAEQQGLGLDGTALYTGTAAPGDVIADEEYTFDTWEGHPQNTGQYHHHGNNPAALAVLALVGESHTVEFYGVMCDGTFVLGCDELDGSAVGSGALDPQNGHTSDIVGPDGSTFASSRYHVHACEALGRTLTPEIQYYDDGTCTGGGGGPP